MTRYWKNISDEDAQVISDVYSQSPQKIRSHYARRDDTPDEFVDYLDGRIYTEWCMQGYPGATSKSGEKHQDYPKLGLFVEWINRETHFAIERSMQRKHGQINHDEYLQTRTEVVRAAARRFLELRLDWVKHPHTSDPNDKRNLRDSLERYIETDLILE